MKEFANLYRRLDSTTKTNEKINALETYFSKASPEDAAWAIFFLSGRKPKQGVPVRKLVEWVMEWTGIPGWLFEESYQTVGDLAETIAHLLPSPTQSTNLPLVYWVEKVLLPLRDLDENQKKIEVTKAWQSMDPLQRFIWNKLITGGFRVGVSAQLVTRALSSLTKVDQSILTHRLMGNWEPNPTFFTSLVANHDHEERPPSQPYPFFLANPLDDPIQNLGLISEWQMEWKWDGIRAQLIKRKGKIYLWSRGEELITDRFPETASLNALPDGTVIDGEILPMREKEILPFGQLQRRIGRKKLGQKLLAEVPVILMAYDLLEAGEKDIRHEPLQQRREKLEQLVHNYGENGVLRLSPLIKTNSWEELAQIRNESRVRRVEGLMLKRLNSPYRVGRIRGDWWKWKVEPFTIDAVLVYAQKGHGKRANLYTDYTFAVWSEDNRLVPVAKAYSGLTDAEIRKVDAFIRKNTSEKFGPVRTVKPELVFELGFEGIQQSTRHKSGIAVRFPRILRWRMDKKMEEADRLEQIRQFLV